MKLCFGQGQIQQKFNHLLGSQ